MKSMPFDRILVAIDGSAGGYHALAKAIELAQVTDATLLGLTVEGRLPAYAATIGEVDEAKREKDAYFAKVADIARAQAEEHGVELEMEIRAGHAAELIVTHAEKVDADLIVVGHKGHFLQDYLLGSTADRVAHHARVPVMIVK
jgi:nucleotide-binding universal stress UspA family protein